MKRKVKNYFKNLIRIQFEFFQRLGINILPKHFYSQIPVIADLKSDKYWMKPYSMEGINGKEIPAQIEFVQQFVDKDLSENFKTLNIHHRAIIENGEDSGFGFVESDFLYAYILKNKPSKIIQVGCGVATSVMLFAADKAGYKPQVVCVDPYPTPYLIELFKKGVIELISEKAQKVDVNVLTDLREGDLFFLDSTHTVKPGSEVNKIILEIFPRLKKGVRLHIHDMFFPYDYTREFLTTELFFWSESVLLQAFLTQNSSFTIKASFSMLHYYATDVLRSIFPLYEPRLSNEGLNAEGGKHFPSSLYLEVIN